MEKTFQPGAIEPRWRQRWEELEVGKPDDSGPRPVYVIALPPANITGALHMGHASTFSVQDTLCRQRRMAGFEVEWTPGTDHAAIATQNVIERQLADEGTSKEELGRERFQARVDAWYEEFGGRIYEQMRRLGYTCDWSRARFTLDDGYVRAIRHVFKALYDEGLIYRGPRIVNWCPRDRSAISDEEIDWQEHRDHLYYLRYPVAGGGAIDVATVRPETMLGDTGVAVAPGDERWAGLIGRRAVLPITGRAVPIVADDAVRPEFGTGAVKVTPAHDPTDYEIGRRHGLEPISVIAEDGTMDTPGLPQFDGLPAEQARGAVADELRRLGALVREEEYVHDIGHCDRCGHVLEPLISEQWWVRMATLAAPGIAAVERGEVTFHPARFTDVYLRWMRNIRDWCISRQIWLGHAIPVSTCGNGHRFAWVDPPTACPECGDGALTNDPDVLDTWFSSALWPFAIYGWPDDTDDFRRFFPTTVLGTGRDIIFLWVARMIMTALKFTGTPPFQQVLISSIIQAADGSRMSKSKGNVVDPLEMVDRYGADAVRAWAAAVSTGSQDVRFDAERIAAFQRFANKLWNATRLLVSWLDGDQPAAPQETALLVEDRWMLGELARLVRDCDAAFVTYRFHDAVDRLYETAWHSYCDWYLEMAKVRVRGDGDGSSRGAALWTATTALDVILRLLHPFMPFVTEECAQHLPGAAPTLQQRTWPEIGSAWQNGASEQAHDAVTWVIDAVQRVRALRQDHGVPAKERDRVGVHLPAQTHATGLEDARRLIRELVPATMLDAPEPGASPELILAGPLRLEVLIAAGAEPESAPGRDRERMLRRMQQLDADIARWRAQLDTAGFLERAPQTIVAEVRANLARAEVERGELVRALEDAA